MLTPPPAMARAARTQTRTAWAKPTKKTPIPPRTIPELRAAPDGTGCYTRDKFIEYFGDTDGPARWDRAEPPFYGGASECSAASSGRDGTPRTCLVYDFLVRLQCGRPRGAHRGGEPRRGGGTGCQGCRPCAGPGRRQGQGADLARARHRGQGQGDGQARGRGRRQGQGRGQMRARDAKAQAKAKS